MPAHDPTHWYEVVGALGGAIGGIAAAFGAVAAWRAARASQATSRDALDALAIGIRPRIEADAVAVPDEGASERSPWRLHIRNTSAFAAREVSVDAEFADGLRKRERWERIAPGESVSLVMREIDTPPGGPKPTEAGQSLRLTFADERDIARYEQSYAFFYRDNPAYGRVYLASIGPIGEEIQIR